MRQCTTCGRRFEGDETVCPDDGAILERKTSFEEQAVGKTLDGKYRIDGFLKRGGMGAVYRGTHLMLNKPVAIKLIKPELVSSAEVVERFLREARAAAHLSHPNIVTVHDLGQQSSDQTLYIAMELVDGKSLKEIIQAEGAWEPRRAVRLVRGIAKALALAHRENIVHRDLKPQNIMVSIGDDGGEVPKLLDFGIAKTFEPTSPALTSTGMVLGTPHYMSAEQASGKPADHRSDLYALGVILYEMLVGKVPFDDTSIPQILIKHLNEPPKPPSTLSRGIPDALERVVLRCLEKNPDERYQSAEEFMEALNEVPDTAVAAAAAAPTLAAGISATVPRGAPEESMRETTMAGAAAVAAPPFPRSSPTGTVRAHQVSAEDGRSGRGWLVLLGAAVVALAVAAIFLLRDRGGEEVSQASVAPAPGLEQPPLSSPSASPAPAAPVAPVTRDEPPSTPEPSPTKSESTSSVSAPVAAPEPSRPRPRTEVPPEPAPPALPERPSVSVECEGVRDGCAALRHAIVEACRRGGLTAARPETADLRLLVGVEEVDARQEEQFGTTIVVRTYAIETAGDSRHFDEELVLPPEMVTFNARLGGDKLKERSRVIASSIVKALDEYWTRQTRR